MPLTAIAQANQEIEVLRKRRPMNWTQRVEIIASMNGQGYFILSLAVLVYFFSPKGYNEPSWPSLFLDICSALAVQLANMCMGSIS